MLRHRHFKEETSMPSFVVGAYASLPQGREAQETYYDLPGKQRRFKQVNMRDPKSHLGLWLGQEFVVIK